MHACFNVETGPTARKMHPFTWFWRKLSALSLLMAIFRRLNAIFIAFYMSNVVQAVFSVETSTAARKSQLFTWFWRKVFVISLLLEIFRSLNAIFPRFYATNAMHACCNVETGVTAPKMQPFTRFWRKLIALSLLLEIFRSLKAIFIAFYTPNVVQAVFSVETSTAARKSQPITRYWRKVFVISLLLEIFRRLNAIFAWFYATNAMHACLIVETGPTARKLQSFTRFWRKVSVISILLVVFCCSNAIFVAIYTPNVVHAVFGVETSTAARISQPLDI